MARPLALITGGWRRIGAAIARQLAVSGHDLALHAHHATTFSREFADELRQAGATVHPLHADLADPAAGEALVRAATLAADRAPRVLVNCASLFRDDTITSLSAASLTEHLAVNFTGPMLLTQAFVAALGEGQAGAVVHILDQRIANPVPDQTSYTLSKQALAGSVRTLARALAPRVRVNAVAPGLTLPTGDYDDAQWERLARLMPLDHLPPPEAIAEAVGFLAGARSVTGQTLFVDAGAHLESYARDFVYLAR